MIIKRIIKHKSKIKKKSQLKLALFIKRSL